LANHKSAWKRNRQNVTRNARNTAYRTQLKTNTKKVLAAIEENDAEGAKEVFKTTTKMISKIASKGVIHKRAASRKISQLAKRTAKLASAS
jgi:small subunit ribosomal protein S20